MSFSKSLISWYKVNHRELPWRNTNDPYKIWLSEVILQQTRVDQGLSYYERFVESYPKVEDLAVAEEDEVLKLWQGLGYYSRARNLLKTARQINEDYAQRFPNNYADLIKLKGIGPYTGAAIASFCFKEAVAVVDGNVYRVLSRIFNIQTPIDSSSGQKEFKKLAQELLDVDHPDIHNQAIMEFGAMVCTPKSPSCESCVFSSICQALKTNSIHKLPVKSGKTKVQTVHINYFVYTSDEKILIRQRTEKGIWQKLWDFPESKKQKTQEFTELFSEAMKPLADNDPILINSEIFGPYGHVLSHRKIEAHFLWIQTDKMFIPQSNSERWIDIDDYKNYAIPRLIERFWEAASLHFLK